MARVPLSLIGLGWFAILPFALGGCGSSSDSGAEVAGSGPVGNAGTMSGAGTAGSVSAGASAGATAASAGSGGASAGATNSGGGSAGASASAGNAGASAGSSSGGAGSCDVGTTSTAWAATCPAVAATCTAGTWKDPGSTTNDPLVCESAHFAVHAPGGTITAEQCAAATNTLETVVWPTFFGSPIFLPEPYCKSATKWKASIVVHSDYGLTGGGWGAGYMGMWIGPGATADHWGLAHEFTHAVQAQTKGLACGGNSNYCGWLYESHANWQAHQLPEYRGSVHCSEMLPNAPHLYLGSTRDRYCNWQFLEYLKDRYCYQAVNDIWNAPTPSNDPFTNMAATRGWSTAQLNDFFGEWAMHNVTWDYKNPPPTTGTQGATYRSSYGSLTDTSKPERRLRTTRLDPLDVANRRYVVPALQAPQRWGYNVVRLYPDAGATHVNVTFRGVPQAAANSDWRWGLVATDAALTTPRYSGLQKGADGALDFCVNAGESLFLVVVGTPSAQQHLQWDQLYPTIYRYPYLVQLAGAQPEGFQTNAPNPSANGKRWPNGNGWVATGATVADGAYVGPYAAVLGGTVAASARIEDHALMLGGTVSGGTVGGLTVMTSGLSVSGTAKVSVAWPYGPGWFEKPQSASGSAQYLGDIELRGANQAKSSGSYCGFVDDSISNNCAGSDVTVAPPYAWRP